MKIRTQLVISITISLLMIGLIGGMLIINEEKLAKSRTNEQISREIVQGSYALNTLQNDFLLHSSERSRLQWEEKYRSLQQLFPLLKITDPIQQETVRSIMVSNRDLKDVFYRIAASPDMTGSEEIYQADTEIIRVRSNRLSSQVNMMIFESARLSEYIRVDTERITRENNYLIIILISALLLVILFNFFIINYQVLRSLKLMQKGTEVIGSGNFDYSVDEIRPDEIGDLSRAFNQMAVNLKAVTTSKAVLEQEVTERKKAQEDLRLSEVRFRTQFEEAMDGICLSDAKTGIIIDCNKALAVLVGRDRDELIGKSQQILYPDDGNEGSTIKGFQLHQTERSVKILQDRVVTMTGVVRDVEIKANILNIQGRSVLQGIFRDITDRKQAEAELLQNYEELKKTQQELRALQAELVKSEKLAVLGKLSGGVGHELRNPLGAIKNAAYFLNMALENPDDDVREVLDIINKEIARCEGIISSLLDFARPKPPSRTQVDIPHVLGEVFKKFPVPGTITVVNTLPSGLPTIEADSNQLIQVFGNLVSNAYQSMLDGGTLTLTSDLTPGSISISVTDTGTGISEENMKKLFEPLFTTKAKGIGLGLVVIQTIVKAHGGRIDVLSTEGKGTTFKVTLPITVNGGVFS